MLETGIENVNYFSAALFTVLVNAALPAAVAIALTSLLAWHKGWNAASRYCAWWMMLGLLISLPFVPAIELRSVPAVTHVSVVTDLLPVQPAGAAVTTSIPASIPVEPAQKRVLPSPVTVFLFCWAAAACLQLVRLLRGFAYGVHIKRRSANASEDLQALFETLLARTGTRRPVSLRTSDYIASPALLGYLRPQVLLPAALAGDLDRSELEQVLLHELAHVARWDDWSIVLQRSAEAIGIFHPLIAYLAYRMNLDREMACDDRVTSLCEPHDYASCLTRIAEIRQFGSGAPVIVPLLLESKSELLTRVESLLDSSRAHMPGVSISRVLAVFACAATVCLAGAFTPRFLSAPAVPGCAMELPAVAPVGEVSAVIAEPPEPPPPMPAAAAAPAPPAKVVPPRSRNGISSMTITGQDGSSSNFGSWSGREKGEPGTITFNSGGTQYVIRDGSTVEEATKLLRPMEELGRKQSELGEQQSELGEKQSALGQKQAALVQAPLDSATTKHLQEQLHDLETKLHQIDIEKDLKTAEDAMRKLGSLQTKLGEMQSRMAAAQGLMGEKQGLLGEEQGKLGEQQGRLGQMQGELGAQQAREARRIEQQLRELIRRAQERGLAQPIH